MSRRWIAVVAFVCAGCPGAGPGPGADPRAPVREPQPWVAPTLPELPPVEAGTLTWSADGRADVDAAGAVLVDGDRLVWASQDGAIRAAPLAGGPATVLARVDQVVALARGHGRVYALSQGAVFEIPRDGAPRGLAEIYFPAALAVGADAIYVADGDWIRAVPLEGGEPETLARDAGDPSAIAATDTHVYWTDGGYEPIPNAGHGCVGRFNDPDDPREYPTPRCDHEQRYGAIKRVAIAGGKVQSRPLFYPTEVAVFDGHVYWADAGDEAAIRTDLDGNHREVVLGGRGDTLAIDATSTVVRTRSGMLVEVPTAGGAPWVLDGETLDGDLALGPDAIYVASWGQGLRRYPRGASRATLLAVPSGKIEDVAVSGDHAYYVDAHFDDRDDAVMRVPRAGGAPELVRTHAGDAVGVRVSGEHVVTFDGTSMALDAGGAPLATELSPDALAIDDRAIYWLQDLYVRAQPFAGGPVETHYQPPDDAFEVAYGSSGGKPPASLSARGGVIVASNQALGAVIRIDTRPPKGKGKGKPHKPKVEVFAEDATTFGAAAGDKILAWTDRGLEVFPGGTLVLPTGDDDWPDELVADAHDAYLVRGGTLVHVPLDGGAPELLLAGAYSSRLALDDDAVYVANRTADALIRIAR